MEIEKISLEGLEKIYAVSTIRKEFQKAVNEIWKDKKPYERYQKKLMGDLAILDDQKERAIKLASFERLSGEKYIYSIRHPESEKNIRILYTIFENNVILLYAFLEKNDGDYQRAIRVARDRIKKLMEE